MTGYQKSRSLLSSLGVSNERSSAKTRRIPERGFFPSTLTRSSLTPTLTTALVVGNVAVPSPTADSFSVAALTAFTPTPPRPRRLSPAPLARATALGVHLARTDALALVISLDTALARASDTPARISRSRGRCPRALSSTPRATDARARTCTERTDPRRPNAPLARQSSASLARASTCGRPGRTTTG